MTDLRREHKLPILKAHPSIGCGGEWSLKLEDLLKRIAEKSKIIVAFSGGVDSSLLAKISTDLLGKNALSVLLNSEILPKSELCRARDLAKSLGLNLLIAEFPILADEAFASNPEKRCYLCKKQSSLILWRIARERGISCIADGLNISDFDDFRPGIAACEEEGIWHPFVDAGISKEEIREIARDMGLNFWNKPSSACLSSRIPYFERITRENLLMVEKAEDFLRGLGFVQFRVRAHGNLARIEISKADIEKALKASHEISENLKDFGFSYVTVDLEGFRSGSMNEVLRRSGKQ